MPGDETPRGWPPLSPVNEGTKAMVRNPRSARVWEKSRDLLLDSLVRPAHRDSGQSPASSWDVQIGSQRDSISVVERDFAVANFVALREDIVPFLAQIQFSFRGILGFKPKSVRHPWEIPLPRYSLPVYRTKRRHVRAGDACACSDMPSGCPSRQPARSLLQNHERWKDVSDLPAHAPGILPHGHAKCRNRFPRTRPGQNGKEAPPPLKPSLETRQNGLGPVISEPEERPACGKAAPEARLRPPTACPRMPNLSCCTDLCAKAISEPT